MKIEINLVEWTDGKWFARHGTKFGKGKSKVDALEQLISDIERDGDAL